MDDNDDEVLRDAPDQDDTMGQEESRTESNAPETSVATLESKLADEVRLRQYTEQVMDTRQLELEASEAARRDLEAEIRKLKGELSNTYDKLADARGHGRAKEKQLSEAKDHIFRLQPSRKDIAESEAVESYRMLCGKVQRWVDNRMRGILDDLDFGRLRTRPAPMQATRFVSFLREAARRGLDMKESDTYHVIPVIMNYLSLVFFSKSFYCPLDDFEGDPTLAFINDLETSMDPAQCRQWRSETLTALTSQQSFSERRVRFLNVVTEDLASLLCVIAPEVSTSELQRTLRRTIVEPAADLAHQLHLAASVYSLKWPARGAASRLEVYECLNVVGGGRAVDLSGTNPNSPARRKVSYLFDVAPGLFVERVDGGKKMSLKAICRPTVLVHAGDGEVGRTPTVMKWLWDGAAASPTGRQSPARAATPAERRSFGAPPARPR